MPIQITISDDSPAASRLASLIVAQAEAETPAKATTECPHCGGVFARETVGPHRFLKDPACRLCREAADATYARFRDAARRHLADFRRNLPQMVRDLRSGLEEPTFYQGWE